MAQQGGRICLHSIMKEFLQLQSIEEVLSQSMVGLVGDYKEKRVAVKM